MPALTFAQTALSPQISKAESGDLQAQLSVAQSYQYGLGAEKDIQEAIRWYERAADQGALSRCMNLAHSVIRASHRTT
ncbi:hypothetical protein [Thalassospira alkalitolerans]|uniref:hypothetical protein n=1 Tax=Thalassospira alkalitolerans TaxID=1293890 RepID=UPI003AA86721